MRVLKFNVLWRDTSYCTHLLVTSERLTETVGYVPYRPPNVTIDNQLAVERSASGQSGCKHLYHLQKGNFPEGELYNEYDVYVCTLRLQILAGTYFSE